MCTKMNKIQFKKNYPTELFRATSSDFCRCHAKKGKLHLPEWIKTQGPSLSLWHQRMHKVLTSAITWGQKNFTTSCQTLPLTYNGLNSSGKYCISNVFNLFFVLGLFRVQIPSPVAQVRVHQSFLCWRRLPAGGGYKVRWLISSDQTKPHTVNMQATKPKTRR